MEAIKGLVQVTEDGVNACSWPSIVALTPFLRTEGRVTVPGECTCTATARVLGYPPGKHCSIGGMFEEATWYLTDR